MAKRRAVMLPFSMRPCFTPAAYRMKRVTRSACSPIFSYLNIKLIIASLFLSALRVGTLRM
jgi:p-aminobenzoyl-glutamate transporter AbgT